MGNGGDLVNRGKCSPGLRPKTRETPWMTGFFA